MSVTVIAMSVAVGAFFLAGCEQALLEQYKFAVLYFALSTAQGATLAINMGW